MSECSQRADSEPAWYVAHTRPRCEKKVAEFATREGFQVTLPLFKSVKKYPSKVIQFEKPLFPNYVFLRLLPHERKKVYQSDFVANLLDIPDQRTFQEQLEVILTALETEYEITALPHISVGKRAKIISGALRGMEGYVEERQGKILVLLRLDFIRQAAAVRVDATDLKLID
jgi:transcription antitermination factor NusG